MSVPQENLKQHLSRTVGPLLVGNSVQCLNNADLEALLLGMAAWVQNTKNSAFITAYELKEEARK